MSEGEVVVVLVTVPSLEVGERIATRVVEEHLAACVNIVPGLRSIFHWEGRVQTEPELLLLIKTRTEQLAVLESRIQELHPYSVPELLVLPVVAGHKPYLLWIADHVLTKGGGAPDQE